MHRIQNNLIPVMKVISWRSLSVVWVLSVGAAAALVAIDAPDPLVAMALASMASAVIVTVAGGVMLRIAAQHLEQIHELVRAQQESEAAVRSAARYVETILADAQAARAATQKPRPYGATE